MKHFLISFLVLSIGTLNAQTTWTFEMVEKASRNVKDILEYTASDGSVYKIGDMITLGNASNTSFVYVSMGDGIISPVTQAGASWGGSQFEIKKMRVAGTKRMGWKMYIQCKGPAQPVHIRIEEALGVGEVVTTGYTSNQALEELKRAKDKLDLGLITQAEYDSLRVELSKYID